MKAINSERWCSGRSSWLTFVMTAILLTGCGSARVPTGPAPTTSVPATASPTAPVNPTPTEMPIAPTPTPTVSGLPTPQPTAEPIPEPTPAPTPEPTPEATPEPTPIPGIADRPGPLRIDGFAAALVTDLSIRSKPLIGTASKILGRLTTGDRVFILKGPVEGSGYAWYRVLPLPERFTPLYWYEKSSSIGWVAAASRDGEPWLQGRQLSCPPLPIDPATSVRMDAFERLSCFGSRTISLVAQRSYFSDLFGPPTLWGTPEWLNYPYTEIEYTTQFSNQTVVRFPPTVGDPGGYWARLTGHFDDPASATCRGGYEDETTGERHEDPVEGQVLGCRLRYVVTEWVALHRVQFRDTLSGIADEYGVTLAALLAANPKITNPSLIHVGDFLTIPGGGSTP